LRGECLVAVFDHVVVVAVLLWEPGTGGNDVVEKVLCLMAAVGHGLVQDRGGARALSCEGDSAGVTAEFGNIGLHPFKGEVLVDQAGIEHTGVLDVLTSEESKGTEAVLDDDRDETILVLLHNLGGVKTSDTEEIVAPAMDPEEDGQVLRVCRCKHVQEQTVLVAKSRRESVRSWGCISGTGLGTSWRIAECCDGCCPVLCWCLWLCPS
jgi:hypothetical protein